MYTKKDRKKDCKKDWGKVIDSCVTGPFRGKFFYAEPAANDGRAAGPPEVLFAKQKF